MPPVNLVTPLNSFSPCVVSLPSINVLPANNDDSVIDKLLAFILFPTSILSWRVIFFATKEFSITTFSLRTVS